MCVEDMPEMKTFPTLLATVGLLLFMNVQVLTEQRGLGKSLRAEMT
jgi:hypothetical protein